MVYHSGFHQRNRPAKCTYETDCKEPDFIIVRAAQASPKPQGQLPGSTGWNLSAGADVAAQR